MAEIVVLAVFAASVFLAVTLDISILIALIFGLVLFFGYGLYRKHSFCSLVKMALSGVKTVKNILFTFVLIGAITGIWRLCGTVPYIVYHASRLFDPRMMVLITFLLCCAVSSLMGTAFGTAATIGVICAAVAESMGIPSIYIGGAILAGSYFGDRCSPMSTSALLVSSVTQTDIYKNISNMLKTSLVPFLAACVVYAILGMGVDGTQDTAAVEQLFSAHFSLRPLSLLPAAAILILSLFRINVKITMTVSILLGVFTALQAEGTALMTLLSTVVFGFHPENAALSALLSGGGILSMTNVFCIVCLSASFSGIFRGTGLLNGFQTKMEKLTRYATPFGAFFLTGAVISVISCSQALAILLTNQLCGHTEKNPYRTASYLENTAVVLAPLVPWGIAGAVPLAAVGAPAAAVAAACYLYFLPLWNLFVNLFRQHKNEKRHCH